METKIYDNLTEVETISKKDFASKLAPPTRAPSISDCPKSSSAFLEFTLPPY